MKLFTLILLALVVTRSVYANCELSWVSEWEQDKNWLHTSAIYPNQVDDPEFNIAQVKQIQKNKDHNQLDVLCDSSEISSCEQMEYLNFENSSCKIDQNSTTYTEGKKDQNFGYVEIYARTHIKNCLAINTSSEIATLDKGKTIFIPQRYPLLEQGKDKADIFLEKHINQIRSLSGLRKIKTWIYSEASLDLHRGHFEATNIYEDSLKNVVLQLNSKVSKDKDGKLCSDCSSEYGTKSLPILIAYINTEWVLIGNGAIGRCTEYFYKPTPAKDWEILDTPFGLPSEFVFYDSNYDKKIDFISLTPREHLPGTKQIYSLFKNKLISITEICTTPGQCRPRAGC